LPATSTCKADKVFNPGANSGFKSQLQVLLAVTTDEQELEPEVTVTVAPASPVPLTFGVESEIVTVSGGLIITGALGFVLSKL
jgi:hypothetical protein